MAGSMLAMRKKNPDLSLMLFPQKKFKEVVKLRFYPTGEVVLSFLESITGTVITVQMADNAKNVPVPHKSILVVFLCAILRESDPDASI